MRDGFVAGAPPQKGITEARVGISVVRLQLQSLLPICDCFLSAACCEKNVAAVIIRVCVSWRQLNRLFIMDHGFIGVSFLAQSVSEIHLYERRTDLVVRV